MGMDPKKLQQQMMEALQQAQQLQEEIEKEVVEGSAGGVVTVKATGGMRITEITIDPSVIDPDDPDFLADTVLAAVNSALEAAAELQQRKLGGMMGGMGGLGLPGL